MNAFDEKCRHCRGTSHYFPVDGRRQSSVQNYRQFFVFYSYR